MRIAILGTKGIPNNYGGFEQFAEYLSIGLKNRGHDVTVYNPSFHPYKESSYHGVKLKKVFSPEKQIGGAANFVYDHLCLVDSLKKDFDIIYEAGYHSVALSYYLLNVKKLNSPVIVTNMDGLEWRRSKWNRFTQLIIKQLERLAVKHSPYLISDNIGIQQYYSTQFNKASFFIPYGASIVEEFVEEYLNLYGLERNKYLILVARLEPENNIELILQAHLASNTQFPLIVVGNLLTKYGRYLSSKFNDARIRFVGGVYDKTKLDALRYFSLVYFHGHSVGGTNPSLLEAMACSCFIWAHENLFNKSVLGQSAFYFDKSSDLAIKINQAESLKITYADQFAKDNLDKIKNLYNWDVIVNKHEELFMNLLS